MAVQQIPECCSQKARYDYLKEMSALVASTLEDNFFTLSDNEADTFLKLFATELKFKWNIKN